MGRRAEHVTLFVYAWFWWYFINREMRDLGQARGTDELGDNPTLSALAVSLGSLIIVPPFVSFYRTCKRIQAAQRIALGQRELQRLGGAGAAHLGSRITLFIPFVFGYIQSELNKVWRDPKVTDPLTPGPAAPRRCARGSRRRSRRPRSRRPAPSRRNSPLLRRRSPRRPSSRSRTRRRRRDDRAAAAATAQSR